MLKRLVKWIGFTLRLGLLATLTFASVIVGIGLCRSRPTPSYILYDFSRTTSGYQIVTDLPFLWLNKSQESYVYPGPLDNTGYMAFAQGYITPSSRIQSGNASVRLMGVVSFRINWTVEKSVLDWTIFDWHGFRSQVWYPNRGEATQQMRYNILEVPLWFFFLLLVAYPVVTFFRRPARRRRRRRQNGLCVECGYNLAGLPEARCPECGMTFPATSMRPPPT